MEHPDWIGHSGLIDSRVLRFPSHFANERDMCEHSGWRLTPGFVVSHRLRKRRETQIPPTKDATSRESSGRTVMSGNEISR